MARRIQSFTASRGRAEKSGMRYRHGDLAQQAAAIELDPGKPNGHDSYALEKKDSDGSAYLTYQNNLTRDFAQVLRQ